MAALRGRTDRRIVRDERGAELIEFALVCPVLLLLIAGMIDMGFLFKDYEVVTNAAREGARLAVLEGYTDADIRARVNDYLAAGGLTDTATTAIDNVLMTAPSSGRTVKAIRVTVTYPHTFLVLGPIARLVNGPAIGDATLRASSTMRVEAGSI